MEKLKVKHDHSLTDIVKVLVFTIFLLAPFIAIFFECCYATFNKASVGAYTSNETAFYQAIERIASQPIFSWTTSTTMYNNIYTFTNTFGLNYSSVVIMITYMIFIVIIYIVFDIIIEIFKKLTHMFNE